MSLKRGFLSLKGHWVANLTESAKRSIHHAIGRDCSCSADLGLPRAFDHRSSSQRQPSHLKPEVQDENHHGVDEECANVLSKYLIGDIWGRSRSTADPRGLCRRIHPI